MKWRTGGTGAQDGATLYTHADAKRFKALIEVHRHQWPPVGALIAEGFTYLVPGGTPMPVAPAEEPALTVVTFEAFALEYVERLVKPALLH